MDKPLVRLLEPIPFEHEGQTLVALRDTARLAEGVVVLQPVAYFLMRFLDGSRTRSEILDDFRKDTGVSLPAEALDSLLGQLDAHCVLDNPRSRGVLDGFARRPAAHAGTAYPDDPDALRSFLDGILALEDAPQVRMEQRLVGMICPHIDLRRGDRSYAWSYGELRQRLPETMTAIVLGISHAPARSPFVLTRKDFDTPLGPVPTDVALVEQLAAACDFDPFRDEFNHFGEHSVEFQAVFLKHLYPRAGQLRLLPVLCGSFHRPLLDGGSPETIPGVASFFQGLKAILRERDDAFLIAGADLAHMGVTFGGDPLSDEQLADLERRDLETMTRAAGCDALGFFSTLQADKGQRGYCGTSAIYTLLEGLRTPGHLHGYQQCNEPGNTSTVTVAAAGFYRAH
ncbi:MAG: AmmeMemoRadiSam system protein B [Vulcanimicrobiota bacterium]